ncbi:hypothetical protein EON76_03570 [bacterium]|nr:MAG: hypothetical protein EON76_03570 [bacterium]
MSSSLNPEIKVALANLDELLSHRSQLARRLEEVDLEIDRAVSILGHLQSGQLTSIPVDKPVSFVTGGDKSTGRSKDLIRQPMWSDTDEGRRAADKDYMSIAHQDVNDSSEVEKNYSHYTR